MTSESSRSWIFHWLRCWSNQGPRCCSRYQPWCWSNRGPRCCSRYQPQSLLAWEIGLSGLFKWLPPTQILYKIAPPAWIFPWRRDLEGFLYKTWGVQWAHLSSVRLHRTPDPREGHSTRPWYIFSTSRHNQWMESSGKCTPGCWGS